MVRYSELAHPIDPEAPLDPKESAMEVHDSISGSIIPVRRLRHAYSDVFNFRGWEIPNVYVMYQAYKMHKEMKAKYPQYGSIDGSDNVWICKPSFTARGVGIFCFRSLGELFGGAQKK